MYVCDTGESQSESNIKNVFETDVVALKSDTQRRNGGEKSG